MNKMKIYGYYDRPTVVGEKLSQEPCPMYEYDVLPPPSRQEQCLKAFAVGEIASGNSKIGAISEKDFVECKDVEQFETLLDECEDMGDCVRAYNKYKMQKFKQSEQLLKEREAYQNELKKKWKQFEEWQQLQNHTPNQKEKDAE